MTTARDNLRGAGLLALTVTLFGLSDVVMKLLFERLPIGEVTFLRGLAVCPLLAGWLAFTQRLATVCPALTTRVLARALVEVLVAFSFFVALSMLPIANATTILFTAPIIATALAARLLGEEVGWRRWLVVLSGFAGVLLVARPATGGWSVGVLFGLGCAVLVAVRDLITRTFPPVLDSTAIAFVTGVVVTFAAATTLPFAWVPPTGTELLLIVGGAGFIAVAYVTIVEAFRIGDISFLAPFRYVSIPLTIALGWLVFGDVPTPGMLAGIAVIVASSLFIIYHEHRRTMSSASAP